MNRFILYIIAASTLFLEIREISAQTQPASMGIFTATADWGLEPDFPPKTGEFKIPGTIIVTGEGNEAIYNVYGNGSDIGISQAVDESFYVYTNRTGAFRISGKFHMLERGGLTAFSQCGLMIRKDGKNSYSPYFAIVQNSGETEPFGNMLESKWRDESDIEAHYIHYRDQNGDAVGQNKGDGVFLRLTYISSIKMAFTEWSADEITWHWMHQMQIDLGDNPSCGIFVNNDSDNEDLAHVQVSQLTIENISAYAECKFSQLHYSPGDVVDVTLTITNPTNTAQNIILREVISNFADLTNISHNGQIDDATVSWALTLMPGEHYIRYKISPSDDDRGFVPFNGWINSIPVIGDRLLTANDSLFHKYADWGSLGFLSDNTKQIQGYAEIKQASGETIYNLYGTGSYWGLANEGMYLYSELEGSYRLSAKVKMMNAGENLNGLAGIMLRGKGHQSRSKNYTVHLRSNEPDLSSKLESIQVNWQSSIGNNRPAQFRIEEPDLRNSFSAIANELYLRITRIASAEMIFSEWSSDGLNWHYIHQETFPFNETAAYGLIVSNLDTSLMTHAQFSDVQITPSPPIANRFFSRRTYQDGDVVIVVLEAFNPKAQPENLHIQDSIPAGWTVTSISQQGKIEENTVIWDINADPGITYLVYRVVAPANSSQDVHFLGEINGETIIGNYDIKFSRLSIEQNRQYSLEQGVYVAVPFTLMLLHLLMYFFYPKMVENFYFALFAASVSVVSYTAYQPSFTPIEGVDNNFRIILVIITVCMMLRFFYSLVYESLPLKLWVLNSVPMILVGGMFVWIYLARNYKVSTYPSDWVAYGIASPGVAILMSESIRILIILYRRKVSGYLILITGMVIMLILIQYVLIWAMGADFGWWDIPISSTLLETPIFFAPVFMSMSVFLAYRFARTSNNLLSLNAELEDRVACRTADLEKANEELRVLDKMKSSFVSQASHDLRTPLTAIKGSLDNLMLGIAGDLSDKQKKILHRALTSVDRLSDLVTDVLDLNRIESGRIVLDKTNFNLNEAVKMMITECRPAATQKNIKILANGLDHPVTIYADRPKLDRVIGELIGNAIKYTPQGGQVEASLFVHQKEEAQNKPYILLSIKDTGIGLSKEDCTKVFERFYRVDAAKNTAKGSGLGLSIVKELVELHEGTIEVNSEPGKGSTFTIKLPITGYNFENAQ